MFACYDFQEPPLFSNDCRGMSPSLASKGSIILFKSGATTDALITAYRKAGDGIGVDIQTVMPRHMASLGSYACEGGKVLRAVHLSAVTTTRCVFAKGEEFLGWVQGIQAPTDDLEGAVVY